MMKKRITAAMAMAGALTFGTVSYGQQGQTQTPTPPDTERQTQVQSGSDRSAAAVSTATSMRMNKSFAAHKASDLIGKNLKSTQNTDLGEVKDLAIDFNQGRVAAVIISHGGTLGVGEKLVAVPPSSLNLAGSSTDTKHYSINVPEEKLKSAPAFKWDDANVNSAVSASYQHFGQTFYLHEGSTSQPVRDLDKESTTERDRSTERATSDRTSVRQSDTLRTMSLKKASDLIGMDVEDSQGTDLGDLDDLVVDLGNGRVIAAILASGGVLGLGETLHAVPPGQFTVSNEKRVIAKFGKEKLDKAPKFTVNMWPSISDPKWATDVYGYYQESPYWDSSRQPVRDPGTGLDDQRRDSSSDRYPQNTPQPSSTPRTPSSSPTPQTPESPSR